LPKEICKAFITLPSFVDLIEQKIEYIIGRLDRLTK
jgi:hypothetical protein